MEAVDKYIKHGWVWVFSILIFFFNSVGVLPEGLTLVLLFTPLWIYLLYRQNRLQIAVVLLLPLVLYIPLHIYSGVNSEYYAKSFMLLGSLIIFILFFYYLINANSINFDLIFRDIVLLNFLLVIGSVMLLYVPSYKNLVWYLVPISENIQPIPRLKLFASEASHYSFFLAPVAIYFYARLFFFETTKAFLMLVMITVPLILSFSLGVLLGIFISGIFILIFYFKRIMNTKERRLVFVGVLFVLSALFVIAWLKFPDNAFFARMNNVFTGRDTSTKGRTYDAFVLAHKIAALKSYWWGIGEGQLKFLGREIVVQYYSYSRIPQTIRIPNACAETIVSFGYIGFALRLCLEFFLFIKTKVYSNPFRLWLFLFVFIYQFTGSYITNPVEYILWILAFSNIFPEFKKVDNIIKQATVISE